MVDTFRGETKDAIYEKVELFLDARESLDFLCFAQANDLAIVGIEAGTFDGAFTPDLNLISDYSSLDVQPWSAFRTACNQASKEFILPYLHNDRLRFYLVLLKEQEWRN